jgi:hypothetical protein
MRNRALTESETLTAKEKARALGNIYDCDIYGRFPWDRSEHDGKKLTLSKSSLGEFCAAVLSHGGDISNFFCMWPDIPRSAVFARVKLSLDAKKAIEASTPWRFDPPPVVKV